MKIEFIKIKYNLDKFIDIKINGHGHGHWYTKDELRELRDKINEVI